MDGLIIGDQYAANVKCINKKKDEDFITNNKIDVIINCCGKQFSN
jgi:hypothetical protein